MCVCFQLVLVFYAGLKTRAHFLNQLKVKPKSMMTFSHAISCASRRFHEFASSFDRFLVLWLVSDYFHFAYGIQLKMVLWDGNIGKGEIFRQLERAYCQARAYLASPIGLFFLCPRKRCLFKHRDRDECIEWEGGGREWEPWGPSLILAPSALASVSALGDYRPFCSFSETFGVAFFGVYIELPA